MPRDLFDITFKGVDEFQAAIEKRIQLVDANVKVAVIRTVLKGARMIAEDCPVDTGRLRSSILGYLAQKYNVSLKGDPQAIAAGLSESATEVSGYRGKIGTNVNYAAHVEYGHRATGPKKLTDKQRRYLFAAGILKSVNGRVVVSNVNSRINRRAGLVSRVKGKGRGFFRRNLVLIDQLFQQQMQEALKAAEEGRLLPITY